MKATPDTTEALEGEQTEFLQYFSWKVGEKVVKYPPQLSTTHFSGRIEGLCFRLRSRRTN